jgi:putative transposase
MPVVTELAVDVGTSAACHALCMPRASYYRDRRRASSPTVTSSRPSPARALRPAERETVLACLHEERFQDRSPAAVYATLLDEGQYHCSIRTMYRLLEQRGESRERRDQLIHPPYKKPELLATAPNQLWSWDITKLLGPVKWTYFYLYVILDVFSRYVTGWMVAMQESAELAKRLIEGTCKKQRIQPGQLTLHADRGTSMSSKPVAFLLADLGVTKTHSRPHVSDDNPYSESQFRTLKYRPEFPDRFGCIQDSRAFSQGFFRWYNEEHRHSGLGLLTPAMVHYGQTALILEQRQTVLDVAYRAHPERFVRQAPKPPCVPTEVWINKPADSDEKTH